MRYLLLLFMSALLACHAPEKTKPEPFAFAQFELSMHSNFAPAFETIQIDSAKNFNVIHLDSIRYGRLPDSLVQQSAGLLSGIGDESLRSNAFCYDCEVVVISGLQKEEKRHLYQSSNISPLILHFRESLTHYLQTVPGMYRTGQLQRPTWDELMKVFMPPEQ